MIAGVRGTALMRQTLFCSERYLQGQFQRNEDNRERSGGGALAVFLSTIATGMPAVYARHSQEANADIDLHWPLVL
ncbi:MAG: hypothetical protein HC853_00755 [Anaerolineae bacterium]|nr:hypothetical protein [Anaerolineae bacterium]